MCHENTGSSKNGGRLSLHLAINVLLTQACTGCRFCKFPYTFQGLIRDKNDKYPTLQINNEFEVWEYIFKLVEESKGFKKNEGKGSAAIALDVYEQLPFFVCKNKLYDEDFSKDIRKYTYCTETGQKPFPGAYGDTPALWIDKFFIIRNTLNEYKERIREKEQRKRKAKNG